VLRSPFDTYGDQAQAGMPPSDPRRIMPNGNGSIIAVSYEARVHGVKRNTMAGEARKLCPGMVYYARAHVCVCG
jgi:nucleotidyltransferase/DNA polymerase involved in DNA repair